MDHKRRRDDSENRHRKHHKSHKKHSSRHSDSGEDELEERRRHRHRHHREDRGEVKYNPDIVIKKEKDDRNFDRQERERSRHDDRRREHRRERDRRGGDHGLNSQPAAVKQEQNAEGEEKPEEDKQKPNFELSGKLTEDTNTFRGVVIKYNEPPEAMIPKRRWRLYPFKGAESLPVLHIHRQSAFLMGRERKIADIPIDHPSCSKQHAVLQFRAVPYQRQDGTDGRRVRPYIIDLESANGTILNGERMEPRRYYELKEKDCIKFGFSSREYVLLHDKVDTSELGEDMEEV